MCSVEHVIRNISDVTSFSQAIKYAVKHNDLQVLSGQHGRFASFQTNK